MSARCVGAAVFVTATVAVWVCFAAPVVAQQISTPNSPPEAAPTATEPVQLSQDVADILKLVRGKIGDDVILAFIENGGRSFSLTASEIIYLRKEGVSDRVLASMLNQSRAGLAPQTSTQPAASAVTPSTNAPQYAPDSTPPPTTVVETAPASTVYVAPSSPTYYSFYDPWPYGYDPWPYWYSSYWCPAFWYPYLSFGFYWGDCGYHHYCHGNNYYHNGKPPPYYGNHPPNGNQPPPNGTRMPPSERSFAGGQPGARTSNGRPPAAVNQTASSSRSTRYAGTLPAANPTRSWSNDGNQAPASRASGRQANATGSRGGQTAGPTSNWGGGANNRTIAAGSRGSQGLIQSARGSRTSASTSVWSGTAGQRPNSYAAANQNAAPVARSRPVSAGPTTAWNRSSSPSASRFVGSPGASYQRSSVSQSSGYHSGGGFPSMGRPSVTSSYGGSGSTSAFRGGGSFSGGSAPRMSSGGGGSRGGGGGGFRGGGGSRR